MSENTYNDDCSVLDGVQTDKIPDSEMVEFEEHNTFSDGTHDGKQITYKPSDGSPSVNVGRGYRASSHLRELADACEELERVVDEYNRLTTSRRARYVVGYYHRGTITVTRWSLK